MVEFAGCPEDPEAEKVVETPSPTEPTEPSEPVETPEVLTEPEPISEPLPTFDPLYFNTSSHDIDEASKERLDKVIEDLKNCKNCLIELKGYTDNVGNDVLNQQLSEKRAKSCYFYLINNGFPLERISYSGYGEQNPIADNATKEGRQLNRRVEIHFSTQE